MDAMNASTAAPPLDLFEELMYAQALKLVELRSQLAQSQDMLNSVNQTHAQLERLLAKSRESVAPTAAGGGELESSPGSFWDVSRLALRPLPVAATARLSRSACREWFTRFEVPFRSSFRRRFTEDDWLLPSSDDESDKPCRSSAQYKQLSRAAQTIQVVLSPYITRKVQKARFIAAYMTLVHASHNKLTRHVLICGRVEIEVRIGRLMKGIIMKGIIDG